MQVVLLEGIRELGWFRQAYKAGSETRTKMPKQLIVGARDRLAHFIKQQKRSIGAESSTENLPHDIAIRRMRSIHDLGSRLGSNRGISPAVRADKSLGSGIKQYALS